MDFEDWKKWHSENREWDFFLSAGVKTDISKLDENRLIAFKRVLLCYEYMCSDWHKPRYSWECLNGGVRDLYYVIYVYSKTSGLENLRSWLGRKYNMLYNIPKSFEVYQGRLYEKSL